MVIIQELVDDAKCFQTGRDLRWPEGVACPFCGSNSTTKNGRDEVQKRFDDLTGTVFANHHQPLRVWITCSYLMGLNLSGLQIARELGMDKGDARVMVTTPRQGIVDRAPPEERSGEVECDEVYAVAGHKGHPEAVK